MKLLFKNTIIVFFLAFLFSINTHAQKIKVGSKMPEFELMDQQSDYFNTADYLNKKNIVIFFYSEDDAPICTREVLSFNSKINQFKELDAVVVGINPASIVYHRKFVIKLELKYPILFDRNNDVQKIFRVPNIKKTKNPQRYTFVVDKKGIIKKIIHYQENAEIHIIESLKALEELSVDSK